MNGLEKRNIRVMDSVENWEVGIREAGRILLENGSIKEKYIEESIKNIKKLGFYIATDNGVAMPHARPEDGVVKTEMSLLKLNKPVEFGNEMVSLIFMMAAKSDDDHIDILTSLSVLAADVSIIEKAKKIDNECDLKAYFNTL